MLSIRFPAKASKVRKISHQKFRGQDVVFANRTLQRATEPNRPSVENYTLINNRGPARWRGG